MSIVNSSNLLDVCWHTISASSFYFCLHLVFASIKWTWKWRDCSFRRMSAFRSGKLNRSHTITLVHWLFQLRIDCYTALIPDGPFSLSKVMLDWTLEMIPVGCNGLSILYNHAKIKVFRITLPQWNEAPWPLTMVVHQGSLHTPN